MQYYLDDPRFLPNQLSQFARQRLELIDDNQPILERWFPNVLGPVTSWSNDLGVTEDFTRAAEHRAVNTPPRISGRPGRRELDGKLPHVSEMKTLLESEIEALQEGRVSDRNVDVIFNDVDSLVRALRNRKELERAEVLETGKIAISSENNLKLDANFYRKATRTASVGTSWAGVGVDTFTPERTFVSSIQDDTGVELGYAIATPEVINAFRKNTDYLEASQQFRVPTELSLDEINAIRARKELPMLIEYKAKMMDHTGALRRVMNPEKIVYLPARPVGVTQWGRPAIANEKDVDIASSEGGPVVFVSSSQGIPLTYETAADAIALAVLGEPDSTGCLQVLGV